MKEAKSDPVASTGPKHRGSTADLNQIVFGCHSLATLPRRQQALDLLARAWDLGIHHFDTAPLYSRGYSESLLGLAFSRQASVLITSKFGAYPVPQTILPVGLAMPLNALRSRLSSAARPAPISAYIPQQIRPGFSSEGIAQHLHATLRRLRISALDTFLLHEILPFDIPSEWHNTLLDFQRDGLIGSLGYGGEFLDVLLTSPLPAWLRVLQFPLPLQDGVHLELLSSWLTNNPGNQVRIFGLFRPPVDLDQIHAARCLLECHPNLSVLFSCRSPKRLEANLHALLS